MRETRALAGHKHARRVQQASALQGGSLREESPKPGPPGPAPFPVVSGPGPRAPGCAADESDGRDPAGGDHCMNESLKDPVCGMTVVPTSRLAVSQGDRVFYFCSAFCRETCSTSATRMRDRFTPAAHMPGRPGRSGHSTGKDREIGDAPSDAVRGACPSPYRSDGPDDVLDAADGNGLAGRQAGLRRMRDLTRCGPSHESRFRQQEEEERRPCGQTEFSP